jgi:hypothetical protein
MINTMLSSWNPISSTTEPDRRQHDQAPPVSLLSTILPSTSSHCAIFPPRTYPACIAKKGYYLIFVFTFFKLRTPKFSELEIWSVGKYSQRMYISVKLCATNNIYTVELGCNNFGLCDTSVIALHIQWYQQIPHKACVFLPRLVGYTYTT